MSDPLSPSLLSPSSSSTFPPIPTSTSAPAITSSQSASRNNPISLRLWKITSQSTLDQATLDALKIVSEHYCTPGSGAVNGNGAGAAGPSTPSKIRRATSSSEDYWLSQTSSSSPDSDSDTDSESAQLQPQRKQRSLLDKHNKHYVDPQAAIRARQNFKKDLEGQLVDGSVRFLRAFEKVDEKLQVLRNHLIEMQARCDSIQGELDSANKGAAELLEKARGLQEQGSSANLRAHLSTLFLTHFTLTPTELDSLSSKDISLDAQLFGTMDRIKGIRRDCRSLFVVAGVGVGGGGEDVKGEKGEEKAGEGEGQEERKEGEGVEGSDPALAAKEIMSLASAQLDQAYSRIHRFCCFEFRKFTKEAHLEVGSVVKEAVKRLRERENLLNDALQILTSTRQDSILQSFLDALTKGGPDGLPRPIELHAHDPTRYVGDMLAWVHQATAGENEFVDGLFDVERKGRRIIGQTREFVSGQEVGEGEGEVDAAEREVKERERLARVCLDKNLDGLSRPLKVRIQHTVKSQEGVIMAYRIANLVQFYWVTMQRTIGQDAALTVTLAEIHEVAHQAFLETLNAQGRSLLRFLHPPDASLAAPVALRESSHILHEIMSVYDTSLVDDVDREADFAKILDTAVDPLMEMSKRMVEMRKGGSDWERDIFMINCAIYLQHVLESYDFTAHRQAQLQTQVDEWVDDLMKQHYGNLLKQSGLAGLASALAAQTAGSGEQTPLSRMPSAESRNVSSTVRALETFLTSVDVLSSTRLALLSAPRIASHIHHGALEKLANDYAKIHAAIMDKANKYEFPSTLMTRTPEEVFVLLGIEVADLNDD